ncbi:MAG: SusD/RagB family nutrient-binding outer membrane lipoprotein [Ignavibacteria bacterium]|nr:SusD/RagB family nutrient-binding outer membrane lipoprotein [Ignavibacteria bacterium]
MKIKVFLTIIGMTLLLFSCDSWIDTNLNVDPTSPSDVPMKTILPTTQVGIAYVLGGDIGRFVGCFTQQFYGWNRQHQGIYNYTFKEDDISNAWNTMYAGPMMDLYVLMKKADELQSPHYKGIAQILMAFSLGMWTDLMGDIPYSDAFKGTGKLTPKYDTQEKIYNSIFSLLDDAINNLKATTSLFKPGADDFMYGGKTAKWIKAAYTLKARYYLHLKKYDEALVALQSGFTSNDDDLQMNFTDKETEANPLYQFDVQRGDVHMGPKLMELMNKYNDPRRPFFAKTDDSGKYSKDSPLGPFYASINSPVPFITYVEAKFIEAECQFAKGNKTAAYNAYKEGILASMKKVGVKDSDAQTYWGQTTIDVGENNISLANILEQKYIACFFSPEVYTDWRRTGLPVLTPVRSDKPIPRRFPYPQSERLYNFENVKAVAPNFQNPDFIFTEKLWWDKTFWNP